MKGASATNQSPLVVSTCPQSPSSQWMLNPAVAKPVESIDGSPVGGGEQSPSNRTWYSESPNLNQDLSSNANESHQKIASICNDPDTVVPSRTSGKTPPGRNTAGTAPARFAGKAPSTQSTPVLPARPGVVKAPPPVPAKISGGKTPPIQRNSGGKTPQIQRNSGGKTPPIQRNSGGKTPPIQRKKPPPPPRMPATAPPTQASSPGEVRKSTEVEQIRFGAQNIGKPEPSRFNTHSNAGRPRPLSPSSPSSGDPRPVPQALGPQKPETQSSLPIRPGAAPGTKIPPLAPSQKPTGVPPNSKNIVPAASTRTQSPIGKFVQDFLQTSKAANLFASRRNTPKPKAKFLRFAFISGAAGKNIQRKNVGLERLMEPSTNMIATETNVNATHPKQLDDDAP
eukprot:gene22785-1369_t